MFKLFEQLYVLHASGATEPADWNGFERAMADLSG